MAKVDYTPDWGVVIRTCMGVNPVAAQQLACTVVASGVAIDKARQPRPRQHVTPHARTVHRTHERPLSAWAVLACQTTLISDRDPKSPIFSLLPIFLDPRSW